MILYIIVAIVLVWIFVPMIMTQANNLGNVRYEQIYSTLEEPINYFSGKMIDLGLMSEGTMNTESFNNLLGEWFEPASIANFFGALFGIAGNLLIGVFSVLFILFFFLREKNLFSNFIIALVPSKYENDTLDILEDIRKLLRNYLAGILLQITIITIFVYVSLGLLGIQNALLIGFFAALSM